MYGMGWDLLITVMSRIYKWDEKIFYFHFYILFGMKIYSDLVPKEMGSYRISSQLEKLLFLIGNKTEWDEIYQSHSRSVYTNGIKNISLPSFNFFMGQKFCPNPIPNKMGSCRIPFYRKKLPSLMSTSYCLKNSYITSLFLKNNHKDPFFG